MKFFKLRNRPAASEYSGVATIVEPDGSNVVSISNGSAWTAKVKFDRNTNTWANSAFGSMVFAINGLLSTKSVTFPISTAGSITSLTFDLAPTTGGTLGVAGNTLNGTLGTPAASTSGPVNVTVERIPVITNLNPNPTPVILAGGSATPISFAQGSTTEVVINTPGALLEGDKLKVSVYTGTRQVETLTPTGTAANGTIVIDGVTVTLATTDDTATKICNKIRTALAPYTDKYFSLSGTSTVVITFRVPGLRTAIASATGAGVTVTSAITTPGVTGSATGTTGLTMTLV